MEFKQYFLMESLTGNWTLTTMEQVFSLAFKQYLHLQLCLVSLKQLKTKQTYLSIVLNEKQQNIQNILYQHVTSHAEVT